MNRRNGVVKAVLPFRDGIDRLQCIEGQLHARVWRVAEIRGLTVDDHTHRNPVPNIVTDCRVVDGDLGVVVDFDSGFLTTWIAPISPTTEKIGWPYFSLGYFATPD